MRFSSLSATLFSLVVATGCGDGTTPDEGSPLPDGGADAGFLLDAQPLDGTVEPDAWVLDGASELDAVVMDAVVLDADPQDANPPADGGPSGVGPAGGTVVGPGGAEAIIPAGALSTFVDIELTVIATSTPSFPPEGIEAAGSLYAFLPHGTIFARPVSIRVPFDPALIAPGGRPRLYWAAPNGSFAEVETATASGAALVASVDHFSYFGPGSPTPELTFSEVSRQCAREALGGNVWCWGEQGVLALNSGFAEPPPQVSVFREATRLPVRSLTHFGAGPGWVCGLDATDLWCIGDPSITRNDLSTTPPDRTWVQKNVPAGALLSDLSAGGLFGCALAGPHSPDSTKVGLAYCWGNNTFGQLGRDLNSDGWEVQPMTTTHRYVALGAAGTFACAARETTGIVECWGSNVYGGVSTSGLGSYDYTITPMLRGVTVDPRPGAVAAYGANACGIQVDGTTYCWGDNYYGQMGNGTSGTTTQTHQPPAEVLGVKFKSISPGPTMCGIALDDRSYCWGHASQGALGNGADDAGGPPADADKQKIPVLVAVPNGVTFASMANTELGKCGRSTSNEIYCWGPNRFFALGTGSDVPAFSNVPVKIKSSHLTRMLP